MVSVMIPAYNSRETLPMSLASLLAQTYSDWEAVVVDDGSTESLEGTVNAANDPRIGFFRFDKNRGRPFARQFALEKCRGDYLCMLDSDDWYYPGKLEKQIKIYGDNPDISLVSTGMAVADKNCRLKGVRKNGGASEGIRISLCSVVTPNPPVACPTAMVRLEDALRTGFDKRLLLAQDTDFVYGIIFRKKYAVCGEVLYVYNEHTSYSLKRILKGYYYSSKILLKYKEYERLNFYREMVKLLLKSILQCVIHVLNAEQTIIKRRSRDLTRDDVIRYQEAYQRVMTIKKQIWG